MNKGQLNSNALKSVAILAVLIVIAISFINSAAEVQVISNNISNTSEVFSLQDAYNPLNPNNRLTIDAVGEGSAYEVTPTTDYELLTVQIYSGNGAGTPNINVSLWNSNGTSPTTKIQDLTVNHEILDPSANEINVSVDSPFNLSSGTSYFISNICNDCNTTNTYEVWGDNNGTMVETNNSGSTWSESLATIVNNFYTEDFEDNTTGDWYVDEGTPTLNVESSNPIEGSFSLEAFVGSNSGAHSVAVNLTDPVSSGVVNFTSQYENIAPFVSSGQWNILIGNETGTNMNGKIGIGGQDSGNVRYRIGSSATVFDTWTINTAYRLTTMVNFDNDSVRFIFDDGATPSDSGWIESSPLPFDEVRHIVLHELSSQSRFDGYVDSLIINTTDVENSAMWYSQFGNETIEDSFIEQTESSALSETDRLAFNGVAVIIIAGLVFVIIKKFIP